MGIKYSMEGFIKHLIINTVGNWNRGFIDHNASGRSLISRSQRTTCRINTVHVSQGMIKMHSTSLIWRSTECRPSFMSYTVQDVISPLFRFVRKHGLVTLTLASFSQRYLAEAQDNINVLEQMKIVT